jgi:hypothetical protein
MTAFVPLRMQKRRLRAALPKPLRGEYVSSADASLLFEPFFSEGGFAEQSPRKQLILGNIVLPINMAEILGRARACPKSI